MTKPAENLAKRKVTGGRIIPYRARRLCEKDGFAVEPTVGAEEIWSIRVRGGGFKFRLRRSEFANVVDESTGKSVRAKILGVVSNPASRDYARRRVITRGAIIETEIGEAKVTSRPSQHAVVNALLIK